MLKMMVFSSFRWNKRFMVINDKTLNFYKQEPYSSDGNSNSNTPDLSFPLYLINNINLKPNSGIAKLHNHLKLFPKQ